MTHLDYEVLSQQLLEHAHGIEEAKRPGYTLGNIDVLHNFRSVAARAGIRPEQAWAVYMLKHVDAILSAMTQPQLPVAEAPVGRFADAMNYLKLGYALYVERQVDQDEHPKAA